MPSRNSRQRTAASVVATPYFEVHRSGIQGLGAFATRTIRKGQRVVEYTGERISNDEADRRYDESTMRRHHTFLFTLNSRTVIDGAVGGSAASYINHSCEPNCEAVITDGRIYIHTLRTIYPGEELVYDYQYEQTGEVDEEQERFYKCLCGAPTCRGTIMKRVERRRTRARGTGAKKRSGSKPARRRRA